MMTWVEISKSAITHNIKAFRDLIGKAPLIMPVVKSNAYGHGIAEISRICDQNPDVDRLAVVNLDEALLLNLIGIEKPIQVLSFFDDNNNKICEGIRKKIIFPLYNLEQAKLLNELAEKIGHKCIVHLKIDTGTTRVGVLPENLDYFLQEIGKLKKIVVEGIWSHFSSSESSAEITTLQNKILLKSFQTVQNFFPSCSIKHIACTAATIIHKDTRHELVRIGIGLYGLYPSKKCCSKIQLTPALSWKTRIIQIKKVKKGTLVGYGGSYKMKTAGKIAVIPVGYYDGFKRQWSNKANVIINGKKCPIRGRICMNLTMIDVSSVNCKIDDIVTLIGTDNKSKISADDLAQLTPDTINYEIISEINPLIPRIVI